MEEFEPHVGRKRHHADVTRNDAKPQKDAADNARNRAAIIISGRLADPDIERHTWEHANNQRQSSPKESP